MKTKIKVEYLKPFGPGILRGTMSKELLDNFTKLSEEVIDKKSRSWNAALVGQINDEWKIPELLYKDFGLDKFLDGAIKGYMRAHILDIQRFDSEFIKKKNINEFKIDVIRGDGWINYMTEGEYNPIHIHSGCSVSSIFFINDYTGDEKIKDKPSTISEDGQTTFVYGSKQTGFMRKRHIIRDENGVPLKNTKTEYFDSVHERGHWTLIPKKGDFYIFPNYLYHMVYPFKGKKKRISASVNYGVRIDFN